VLVSVAVAVAEFWSVPAGVALGAVAFFVALRPLFMRHRAGAAKDDPS